ncbi:hypothetical protein ACE1N8_25900 [Streptomyces sp. DSM 116494]|uniref:hypothetical protein n=1 Tax=Streptomyces okerensis TaxID=3344655 RepID=UPI00388D2DB5
MAGGTGQWRRRLVAVLLAVFVMGSFVTAHTIWASGVKRSYEGRSAASVTNAEEAQNQIEADIERKTAQVKDRYRGSDHPQRTGTTTIKLEGTDLWRAVALHRLTLSGDDPMISDLRRGDPSLGSLVPFTAAVSWGHDGCSKDTISADGSKANRVTQDGPDAKTLVSFEETEGGRVYSEECADQSPLPDAQVVRLDVDGESIGKGSIYDRWTVRVQSKEGRVVAASGARVLRQSSRYVEFTLQGQGPVTVTLGEFDKTSKNESDLAILGAALQSGGSPLSDTLSLAACFIALLCCLILPFIREWAPAAFLRRWQVTAIIATAVTTGLLLFNLGAFGGESEERPAYSAAGTFFTAWWWVMLPLLLLAVLARVVSGHPPRLKQLLLVATPGLAVASPMVALSATDRAVWPWLEMAIAISAAGAVGAVLRGGLLGAAGRRWAATAAVTVLMGVLAIGAGAGLPASEGEPGIGSTWLLANILASYALEWFWPAVFLVTLLMLGQSRWVAAGVTIMLWLVLGIGAGGIVYDWRWMPGGPWTAIGVSHSIAAQGMATSVQTGVLFTIIFLLWRHSVDRIGWPLCVRTGTVALGISAAATMSTAGGITMIGASEVGPSSFGLTLLIACVGFAWLVPRSAKPRALRLHATTPAAHTRRIHALLKDQTLAASRRVFLISSHTALAEGQLSPRQWSARWRKLGGLARGGTAPQHSIALRASALGSSGGREAWRNGVAAAVLVGALSLPWSAYTLPPRISQITTYDPVEVVAQWSTALRWPLYGFVYGYLYSWLRGNTPLGRAMCLLAVVLPVEIANLLYAGQSPADFSVALLLTSGDCLAVFLILGLYWEARQVRAAGLRWGQIRNFRSLSALAVPATTIVVAVTTAVATALIGVWATPAKEAAPGLAPTTVSGSLSPDGT